MTIPIIPFKKVLFYHKICHNTAYIKELFIMEKLKRVLNYDKPSIGLKVVRVVNLDAEELRRKRLVRDRRRKVELLDRCYRVLVQLSER